jgi:DNA-binding CsgD family transcriptional regulator
VLPVHLHGLGICAAWGGELPAATSLIAEADAVAEATGTRFAPYATMLLGALRGREAEASELITSSIKEAAAEGQGIGVQYAHWVAAILCNGLGRYDEALAAAQQASEDIPELYVSAWALPELIEAATRCGKAQRAADALERLAESTNASDADWGRGIEARSRALVSEGEAAEGNYREAIDRLGRTRLRPEFARAHLLYGEWLRRERRPLEAREQLRTAHEMFTSMGTEAFAGRAERELLATGEHVRKRSVETRDELTPQEGQIARLARDGLSNAEIGAQLFISQHTVAYHLRKVFSKLDITSRNQLARVLPESAGAGQVA